MADAAHRKLTIDECASLFDDPDRRVELIDGQLVYEAEPRFDHGDAQSSTVVEIKSRFGGSGPGGGRAGWWIATEVFVEYGPTRLFRHDIAGWRKDRTPERPSGPRVRIRPAWVCEVLSTNRRTDLVEKRAALHMAGVPYYWLLDPDARVLTVLRHHADGYLILSAVSPGDRGCLEPFEAAELDVAKLFGDLA